MCADSYITHAWPHITTTCPVGNTTGWGTSAVCPPDKRLVRLAVDQAEPFKVFELRNMFVAHAGQLSNDTLLPFLDGAVSTQPWGCAHKADLREHSCMVSCHFVVYMTEVFYSIVRTEWFFHSATVLTTQGTQQQLQHTMKLAE